MTIRVQRRQPIFLQKGIDNLITIQFEDDGEIETNPVAVPKFTLYDSDGTSVKTGAMTLTAETLTVTYTLAFEDIADEDYSSDYRITIDLYDHTNSDPEFTFDFEAIICRRAPRPPLTVQDLQNRISALYGDWELPEGKTTFEPYIDEAMNGLVARMFATGILVHQVTSWYGFREYLARKTEEGIAKDLMLTRSGSTKWLELWTALGGPADDPRSCEWAWAQLGYRIDRDQDGTPDTDAASESRPGDFYQTTNDDGWRGF